VLRALEDIQIIIYEPRGAPEPGKMVRNRKVPEMTPGRAALVSLMHRYLAGLLDPFVTLLEIHKLMYFLQTAGEPLELQYTKDIYGPYAANLRHVLNAIEGHFISGYADGDDAPGKKLELVPGALEDANNFLKDKDATREHLERVFDLVDGFESSFGLELLSTVHWVASNEWPQSIDDVIAKTYAWNERKKRFSQRQIKLAFDGLARKNWLTVDFQV